MKKILISTLVLLIGLVSMSFAPAKDGVVLRLNPKANKTYTINTKITMMNLMDIQGQTMTSTQSTESRQSITAKEIGEQEVSFEGKVDAMKMTISQMGMTLTYDSEHPEKTSPLLADQVKELNASLDEVSTSKFDKKGNSIDEEQEASLTQFQTAIIPLPEEAIHEGYQWNSKRSQDVSGIAINSNITYTVKKITKKHVELEVKGVVEGDETVSGTYEGAVTLSTETGMVENSTIKQSISLTISQQGMSIPMTITGTTTTTVE
ncbi:MAG: hypothetical protein K6A28_08165 [Bacteroidales bacterium]|nr:hypothetical protein [Bacteroidales bacterium]